MGTLDGKVALVTGAARGQGRSHAIRLAEEGADVVAIDVCAPVETVEYRGATTAELAETAAEIEKLDRRVVARQADVRDLAALQSAVADGVAELGRLDVVVANAGIFTTAPVHELSEEQWDTTIEVNLTGVWKTVKATVPTLIEQGTGGSVILISSTGGVQGFPNFAHYVAAKHGVIGLARTMANELGQHEIRVNAVQPTSVLTDMIDHVGMYKLFRPDLDAPTREDFREALLGGMNILPTPWVEPRDISNAVAWLASDQARFVTGTTLPVDAGALQKM
ncbi:mycofactocin-coupled SDR family oxidoreductase [Pseudonocardia sp. NPDC049154]|uniref:mycofactocin-coupled SDR family oxidoreductase n=1 Tax=Pseudonocardia sp. NPDC049154 TaxID=3155501 RepID=UPI0033E30079